MKILKRSVLATLACLSLAFGYLVYKHGHVLVYLYDFPKPTEAQAEYPDYDFRSFGASIKAGYAKRDITPGRFSWVAGFMPPHPGLSIKDRLWVKSLALRDKNGEIAVFVSCDLIGLLPDELKKIFSLVKNVPRDRIFITTTHTHSGPDTMGLWIWKNEKYMRRLRSQIAEAIDFSGIKLTDSKMRFGTCRLDGMVNGRDENPPDGTVSVIQVLSSYRNRYDSENEIVTLVNFACHPDVVQGLQFTADFPYFLEKRLKARVGGEVMFIPGAIGGVQPNTDRRSGHDFVRKLGEMLADEVVSAMSKPDIPRDASIRIRKLSVSAPFENTGLLKKADDYGLISNIRDGKGDVSSEVSRIDIGPLKILTVPGELFPKIWWKVKRDGSTLMFGLANGEFGYILLPEDYHSGKNDYHASVSVGPTFGTRILEALEKLMVD
mgnify:FL=1